MRALFVRHHKPVDLRLVPRWPLGPEDVREVGQRLAITGFRRRSWWPWSKRNMPVLL